MTSGDASSKKAKSLWLVWSDGFASRFIVSFLVMGAACVIGWQFHSVQMMLMEIQSWISLQLMQGAHKMAWWSVIGLLSSSCCAIQIVLNAMSLGCAGFNSVLGPIRPYLLAFSLLIQCIVWTIARTRPYQLLPCIIGASGSVFLTLLPELLYLYNSRSSGRSTASGGKEASAVTLQLQEGSMGCISCVQSVQAVLNKTEHVEDVTVSLETGAAKFRIVQTPQEAAAKAKLIVNELEDSGFPSELVKITEVKAEAKPASLTSDTATKPSLSLADVFQASFVHGAVAGLLSSSCCLLQLALNVLATLNVVHVGCAGFNKVLGPVRLQLRCISLTWLGGLWLSQLLPASRTKAKAGGAGSGSGASCCDPESESPKSESRAPTKRTGALRLVAHTALTLALMFLPEILKMSGGPAVAPPVDGSTDRLRLVIDGMGCEACQLHVRGTLERSSGVISSSVDFEKGTAEVLVARGWGFNVTHLSQSLSDDGYDITNVKNDSYVSASGSRDSAEDDEL